MIETLRQIGALTPEASINETSTQYETSSNMSKRKTLNVFILQLFAVCVWFESATTVELAVLMIFISNEKYLSILLFAKKKIGRNSFSRNLVFGLRLHS